MLKILHVIPVYFPAFKYGGPSVSIHVMNKALVKKGIKIDVMTTNAGLEERKDIVTNQWLNLDGMRVRYFPYFFKGVYAFSPSLFWTVLKGIKKYDVVQVTTVWNFPVLAASIGCLISKKPYMIMACGTLYPEAINLKSKYLKKVYYYLVARHYINNASAILYNSKDEKERVADFLHIKNKSFVVPLGLDLSEFKYLPEEGLFKQRHPVLKGKRYILFLGRIHPKKGIDILVEAFKELAKDYNDLYLVIAGPDNDDYKKEIEKKLKEYHLLEKALFPGLLSGQEKLSAYVDAEVYVLSSYSENFAVTIIESIACGTPVVISNKIGIFEVIQKHSAGVIVDLNPRNLYQGIKTLLENPLIGAQFVRNGRKLIEEKYDIDKVADVMIRAYEDVLTCGK